MYPVFDEGLKAATISAQLRTSNVQLALFMAPGFNDGHVVQKDEGKEGRPIIHPQHERREGHEGDG